MKERWAAILLAGAIQRSPLARQLDLPALCLPMDQHRTLLETWVGLLERVGQCTAVRAVMSSQREAEQVQKLVDGTIPDNVAISAHADPTPWRGTAGLIHDIAAQLANDQLILVIEANCLPPVTLQPLFDCMNPSLDGVVGMTDGAEPAGIYLMRRRVVDQIRSVGFVDLKEQFLPDVYARGGRIRCVTVADTLVRIRTQSTYLQAVRQSDGRASRKKTNATEHAAKGLAGSSTKIYGTCRIADTATIEHGAIVHDSVLLDGAVVESNAVVSRCVVSPHTRVPAFSKITDQIVTGAGPVGKATSAIRRMQPNTADALAAPVKNSNAKKVVMSHDGT